MEVLICTCCTTHAAAAAALASGEGATSTKTSCSASSILNLKNTGSWSRRTVAAAALGATAPYRDLPRPMKGRPDCNFSFSGLKTALRQRVDALRAEKAFDDATRANLAAGFQQAVVDCLIDRTRHALKIAKAEHPNLSALVVAGGVAANQHLRASLIKSAADFGVALVAPPPRLCTDNAAMIAWAGIERLRLGERSGFDYAPRPRWPLDEAAPVLAGAGVKA